MAPVAMIMICAFANIFTYGVEWCLYALYFRVQYGWSGAWCGFAQMVRVCVCACCLRHCDPEKRHHM